MSVGIIVPSRSRPDNIKQLLDSLINTHTTADLIVALDDDDEANYPRYSEIIYEVNPRMRMIPTLNHVVAKYVGTYDYIVFMGDDHRPRTQCWDQLMAERIGECGIAYGDDLLRGVDLATAAMVSSNIIIALGYMVPPGLKHMCADNFWMAIGTAIGKLHWMPEIVIEHMHFSVGKSTLDESYTETNLSNLIYEDLDIYNKYLQQDYQTDVRTLKDMIHGMEAV